MKDKKKIYILHGWAYSTEKWKPFLEELGNADIEVVMLKIPGLTAPLNEVWDINNYIDWLDKILRKEKDKVVLLGHSNGGLISLSYSLKYPEKVGKLFLIDSTGIYHKEIYIRTKRFVFMLIAKIGKKITKSHSLRKLLYKAAGEHDYEKADRIVQKTMRNLIEVDYSQVLKNLRMPTIIIWGKEDSVTPVKDGEIMHKEIMDSKLVEIIGAKHSPQHTHFKQVAEIVKNNI